MTQPLVVHVVTVPTTLRFLRGQIGYIKQRGFAVSVVASPGPELGVFASREDVRAAAFVMERRITPLADLRTVWQLSRFLRDVRPSIVHAHTPKAGLLGMLAAALARVPVRIYHMRGLPLTASVGARRTLMKTTERVSCGLAHRVLCVSHSIRSVAIEEGLAPAAKVQVLAKGSGNGVDGIGRFDPVNLPPTTRLDVRRELGIDADALVVGFVGRIVRDKGVEELAGAWQALRQKYENLHLVIAGRFEARGAISDSVRQQLESDERVHVLGSRDDIERLYRTMDLLVLPTYREGFPNVVLEAGAMELPVVATRVPGCVDAVVDGVTGTLVPARDADALGGAIAEYVESPELRAAHGAAGRARVLDDFKQQPIWEHLAEVYSELCRKVGIGVSGQQ